MVQIARRYKKSSFKTARPKVVAVIPCLNTESNIAQVVTKARKFVDEVLVIDDGSTDMTALVADIAGATVIRHDSNRGKGAAMKTAAQNTDADIIVFIDGDGQHDPDYIPGLLEPILKQKADFVIGSRFMTNSKRHSVPFCRRMANALASVVISLIISFCQPVSNLFSQEKGSISLREKTKFGHKRTLVKSQHYRVANGRVKWITDCTCGFTAVKMKNWHRLNLTSDGYQIETEMIYEHSRNGFVIAETPICCSWKGSSSRLSIIKDGLRTLLLLTKKLVNYPTNKMSSKVNNN